ncbi:hypothetical protein SAMN05421841_2461 [Chryseobacterium wanjuense]|jgi:hypothetical protein|uniref:Uncharacterized protein n=1 Tax=Chryseobacterium wanjuense TaxID=356305 RepID=A0A1I0RCM1_9FLAO|nr:hypothetical protein [Chryseobacterium wanjuense]SEW38406.1 hypothetical protein SAMN05421841_2461 [Chryseobacterium wanjuense]
MKNIKFSKEGKVTFLASWLLGTILLLGYIFTKSWIFAGIGFYYVLAAIVINVIVFFHEFFAFIIDVTYKKSHGNSALLILLNIPIAIAYFFIFCSLESLNL